MTLAYRFDIAAARTILEVFQKLGSEISMYVDEHCIIFSATRKDAGIYNCVPELISIEFDNMIGTGYINPNIQLVGRSIEMVNVSLKDCESICFYGEMDSWETQVFVLQRREHLLMATISCAIRDVKPDLPGDDRIRITTFARRSARWKTITEIVRYDISHCDNAVRIRRPNGTVSTFPLGTTSIGVLQPAVSFDPTMTLLSKPFVVKHQGKIGVMGVEREMLDNGLFRLWFTASLDDSVTLLFATKSGKLVDG